MEGASILLVGVLVVGAVLFITTLIVAVAPYIAGVFVLVLLCWFIVRQRKGDTSPRDMAPDMAPDIQPRQAPRRE